MSYIDRTPHSLLLYLECSACAARYDADAPHNLCHVCGKPLLARYNLATLGGTPRSIGRWKEALTMRPPSLWRYLELLPLRRPAERVTLGESMTPLLDLPRTARHLGLRHLTIKDEGLLPTGSFKARGAAIGVSRARELGITHVAMPTAGNAGGAWAAYAARAGLRASIVMPQDAPAINVRETWVCGAELHLVRGLISDAGAVVSRAVARSRGTGGPTAHSARPGDPAQPASDGERPGVPATATARDTPASGATLFDAATLKEPYRIEGKKTMGFELAEQLAWTLPDAILYPCGGVGLIGMWKAFDELEAIGAIGAQRPRLIVVQAAGCAPIVRAWEQGNAVSAFWDGAATIAGGLRVPKALGDFLVLRALRETGGCAVAVNDAEILAAVRGVARQDGLFLSPEGAATVAALPRLQERGLIAPTERLVLFNTGAGLKYPESVSPDAPLLDPAEDLAT